MTDEAERESRLAFLRAFLAERDVPCPLCGYNLRALTREMCPECGSEVQVTVGLTEPRMAAFIAGVVGLAAGVGFNGLMLMWVAWMRVVDGRGGPRLAQIMPLIVGFVVTAIGLWLWTANRRRIRRMAPASRVRLVVCCFALSLAPALVFMATVR